jgi:hypothetical protein
VAYRWRYLDEHGTETTGPDLTFPDQPGAEAWFTETWPELLDDGVHAVTLLETADGREREVYGPMGLRAG